MLCIILVLILVYIAIKVYKTDCIDRTHPFGTDSMKNNKYAKNHIGEEYGVGTFWGRPSKLDNVLEKLNKIEWLSNSCANDVFWRRSIVVGIFSGILLSFALDYTILLNNPSKLLLIIFTIFIISYFTTNYYIHHFLWRRIKFINTHIRKIKSDLELPLYNNIYEKTII